MNSDCYEYIDLEAISDIADGDAEFIREIIGNYLSTVSESMGNLSQAIIERNTEQIVFFAHKLKGSFGFVGAERLQNFASDVEGNPTEVESLKSNLSEMIFVADRVEAELKTFLNGLNG